MSKNYLRALSLSGILLAFGAGCGGTKTTVIEVPEPETPVIEEEAADGADLQTSKTDPGTSAPPSETSSNDSSEKIIETKAEAKTTATIKENDSPVSKTETKTEVKTETEPAPVEEEPPKTEEPAPSVKSFIMTAKQWEFTPGTITVKKGDTVRLSIKSIDVDHGFAISAFNVNTPLQPGETTAVEFVVDKTGTFTFFCSVFCGAGHGSMKGTLVVTE